MVCQNCGGNCPRRGCPHPPATCGICGRKWHLAQWCFQRAAPRAAPTAAPNFHTNAQAGGIVNQLNLAGLAPESARALGSSLAQMLGGGVAAAVTPQPVKAAQMPQKQIQYQQPAGLITGGEAGQGSGDKGPSEAEKQRRKKSRQKQKERQAERQRQAAEEEIQRRADAEVQRRLGEQQATDGGAAGQQRGPPQQQQQQATDDGASGQRRGPTQQQRLPPFESLNAEQVLLFSRSGIMERYREQLALPLPPAITGVEPEQEPDRAVQFPRLGEEAMVYSYEVRAGVRFTAETDDAAIEEAVQLDDVQYWADLELEDEPVDEEPVARERMHRLALDQPDQQMSNP
ncbi:hypothetical protein KC340_g2852 [Hortaea werneckii]|nr:hypothetical protein KC342_g14266 [Hortaea werneckii]KAI7067576.1 hypothetical protein KC339_g15274 [Hortaea werneckii]KAI7244369.1 hypothetical protein KC365_g1454 [Hortaea werneckii]KAI7333519.1 hypothetical protein KC340_g2852 [Hortaea werneckii]KAI7387141.1 hypothetical protein KC328_g9581 [Hortaea werneckii]